MTCRGRLQEEIMCYRTILLRGLDSLSTIAIVALTLVVSGAFSSLQV